MTPEQPSSGTRVVVAMSGGVDSSVAAAMLVEQGYDVIGMMLRLWSEPELGPAGALNRCCTPDQMADARLVAAQLGIPFYVVDAQEAFYEKVVHPFIEDHAAGVTPNPCIACNRSIRFDLLLKRARALGADYLATGHYARVERGTDRYRLLRGIDHNKDQSYVLHVLGQDELATVLFPLGAYSKKQIRSLATRLALPVANKSESMDLCFLGDGDYRRFLSQHAPEIERPGSIVTSDGDIVGQHRGLAFYTIGQRKGLGINVGRPLFVVAKDSGQNRLVVGPRRELGRSELVADKVNWVAGQAPERQIEADIKIRYRALSQPGSVTPIAGGQVRISFHKPVLGITPGQGAVFYRDEECLGGGIICQVANDESPSEKTEIKLNGRG